MDGGEMKVEINRKDKVFGLVLIIAILSSFTLGYCWQMGYFHRSPQVSVNIWVFKETPQGTETLVAGNVITDIGERYIRNILGFDNETNYATKWITLGNSSIAQTKTQLDTEAASLGFERALGTVTAWISSGDYSYNVTKKFTATGDITINATGLQWVETGASNNNLFALASLGGAQSFQNNWNCTIVWTITWNAN